MIITPKPLTITQLLSAESEQYVVPAYQRRYSWHEKQIWELLDDICLLDGSDTHLLGSIVCLTGHHTAGINRLELVDGQQRLTTIGILLQCVAQRLTEEGEVDEARDIEKLLRARALGESPVPKILLDSLDSEQFDQQLADQTFAHGENVNLALAFSTIRGWVKVQKLGELGSFLYRLKNQCVIIRLEVSDAKDAFKLFETINNRGLSLSAPDIIKNFILGNAARFGPEDLALARKRWAELIYSLDGTSFESFFRQFLCAQLKRRITSSFVISNFKAVFMKQVSEASGLPERHFYDEDPPEGEEGAGEGSGSPQTTAPGVEKLPRVTFAAFLGELINCAKVYGEIARASTGVPIIDRHLRNLRMIKSLPTYGFLMALRVGGCGNDKFVQILRLTESFLIRRHICRERTNENERLFARLCGADCSNPLPEVTEEFHRFCPSDVRFEHEFDRFEFTANLIDRARYCLEQFELQEQGRYLELLVGGSDAVHVEHIIPQKIKTKKAKDQFGDWPTYLGSGAEEKHPHFVSRIGNLTLFAGTLNIGASNNPYERKKAEYQQSAIKLTNSLPQKFADFRYEQVEARSTDLAKRAVKLWPAP